MQPVIPCPRPNVVLLRTPDGGVLIDEATGNRYTLNATAAQAWELCDGQRTLDDIADALLDCYEATPEEVWESLDAFVAQLREMHMLEQRGA